MLGCVTRLLHIVKVKGIGGCERHLLDLLPALAYRGFDIHVCVLTAKHAAPFLELLEARGVNCETIPAGPDLNPALVARIRRLTTNVRPSIIHTHLIHGDVYGQIAARLGGILGVSTVHGAHAELRKPPFRAAAFAAGRSARRTIAISEHVRKFLEELRVARPDAVRVVHYGIDAADWSSTPAERADARHLFGAGVADVVVGAASRLIPGKGHEDLVEAMGLAVSRVPELKLVVAGDGPTRPALESRARGLPEGSVQFLGFRSDVRAVMAGFDVLAFPTTAGLSEGFGLAALEAMASARPVIATRVGSLPEIVIDGRTGLLVHPGDSRALADALVRLGSDPELRARLGDAARKRASAEFSLQKMVDKTLDVYAELGVRP
jgi:glycosyltransferase involved in cell wall biosynthesis